MRTPHFSHATQATPAKLATLAALATLALIAVLAPANAFAQSASTDAAAESRIRVAIENAGRAGVPESLLEDKVREGRAKGVAEARIAAAVEHRADVLARVRAALEGGSSPEAAGSRPEAAGSRPEAAGSRPAAAGANPATAGELTAAADAHERGVSLAALAAISARSGGDRSVALSVLADLVASGRASENALMRVEAALARGNSALAELGRSADARAGAAARVGGGATRGGGN